MTLPRLDDDDLALLPELMPGLDFSDPERAAVLKAMNSCDVQAAPGSGKTTLLAAKLMLLAAKWKHTNRGICVISHTNVAAAEIARRLQTNAIGASVLGYPHFIGTIHSFINTYFAIPQLRSKGIDVDSIDNEIFAKAAIAGMQFRYTLREWAQRQKNGSEIIESLIHIGPDLALGTEVGSLPASSTTSWKQAYGLKESLSARGIFRHADTFAFASKLLRDVPSSATAASWRFPLVLIDEMQDTDADQEAILGQIFDSTVVLQRFGDRNQRILSHGKSEAGLTFPRDGALTVSSTMRFFEKIAAIVSSVQEYQAEVKSSRSSEHSPALIVYDDATVTEVIRRFGEFVIESLTEEEIGTLSVKAICSRKSGDSKAAPGRHIPDYHTEFSDKKTTKDGNESIRRLIHDPEGWGVTSMGLASRVRDISRALLLCLRAGKSPLIKDVRDAGQLMRSLRDHGVDVAPLRLLRHELTISTDSTSDERWDATKVLIFNSLKPYLDDAFSLADFTDVLDEGHAVSLPNESQRNRLVVEHAGRSISIDVATIASVKGETHVATLVLDGMVRYLNKHDISTAMPSLALGAPIPKKPPSIKGAYRAVYVGMSRPTTLLAMATHRDRMSAAYLAALQSKGWVVLTVNN